MKTRPPLSAEPRLVVVGPLPPPIHGVTISTSLVLANEPLRTRFDVHHLNTSDTRDLKNLGHWDLRNVVLGLRALVQLMSLLRPNSGVLYLPISQNVPAFLRDSLLIRAASARGWRVAVHLRGGEFDLFYRQSSRLARFWIRRTLGHIDSIAVLGSALTKMFDGLVPRGQIAVVTNGTPNFESSSVARQPETVLFMGNLLRRKGVVESVEAGLRITALRPSAKFIFAGEWESDTLERELRKRIVGHESQIAFLPPATGEEKRALLASAGVFLFPPREPEGQPRAVLEAMAAGLPVITTDRGALAETVVHGETGIVLSHPRPDELVEQIALLLDDPARQAAMGLAAAQRHSTLYSQARADLALTDWLDAVATSKGGSTPIPTRLA